MDWIHAVLNSAYWTTFLKWRKTVSNWVEKGCDPETKPGPWDHRLKWKKPDGTVIVRHSRAQVSSDGYIYIFVEPVPTDFADDVFHWVRWLTILFLYSLGIAWLVNHYG